MTQMTQEEIMANTKTVVQGLEALKNEHNSILNGLTSSLELTVSNVNSGDCSVVEEKKGLVQKSLDMIDLGLGEAQVGSEFKEGREALIGCDVDVAFWGATTPCGLKRKFQRFGRNILPRCSGS